MDRKQKFFSSFLLNVVNKSVIKNNKNGFFGHPLKKPKMKNNMAVYFDKKYMDALIT